MRPAASAVRVVGAIAVAAAVIGQLVHSLGYWNANGVRDLALSIVNFFSFFTVLSNVGTVAVFAIGAVLVLRGRSVEPRGWTVLRACVATYMITTGIVYNLLLRGIELPQGATLEWSNEILHVVGPALVLIDWVVAPGRNALPWSRIWAIIAFPLVWIAYTLLRGPITPNELAGTPFWYPYPFLNPNLPGASYATVAVWSAIIAVVIVAIGIGVILVSRTMRPLATAQGD